MANWEYRTSVITHGLMGRKEDELDREALDALLAEHGAEKWELVKVLLQQNLHNEKDGHVLIFKRPA
ncbi:MAG: DUF4177 domain-containing protein [Thermoleophilaceae bacterium]|nr:DUF4177 domain-containing protein [Thermoleophilaceae bacterium]